MEGVPELHVVQRNTAEASQVLSQIDWPALGPALETLFKYEQRFDGSGRVGPDLITTIVSGSTDSRWRRYLLYGNNLARLVEQLMTATDEAQPREILAQVRGDVETTSRTLVAHLGGTRDDQSPLDVVYHHFPDLLESERAEEVADVLTAVHHINESFKEGFRERAGFNFSVEQAEVFLKNFSVEETIRRLKIIAEWMIQVNRQNHDGVTLTPVLVEYLSQPGDLDSKLAELNRLRDETRRGRFEAGAPVHHDTEFHRFVTAYTWDKDDSWSNMSLNKLYQEFLKLEVLPVQENEEFILEGQHAVEAKRTAYEAFRFLEFVREFRVKTTRPIVVVGNDRYGRQWVVEPIEEYLKDGFTTRSFRAPSHKSTRLTVPHMIEKSGVRSGFTRDFVEEMSERMPHIILVDARNPGDVAGAMRLSRATRDYANWFVVFNDLRSEGDGSQYESHMPFPPYHFGELKKWRDYVLVKRQLEPWVAPGLTYKMTLWAPELTENGILGDFVVPRPDIEIGGDDPLVVLANPLFNVTDNDDHNLHPSLRGNRSYYFDGPEQYVTHDIVFGFGSNGLETRVLGTPTDVFVETVQRAMKREIARLLQGEIGP